MTDPGPWQLLSALVASSSQKVVAEQYGISPQYLNDILKQRRDISATLADRLGYRRRVEFVKKRNTCDSCLYPDTCEGGFVDCNAHPDR